MNEGSIALTIMSLLILISFLGFLIWGIKSGQFKDVEEAKYNMFKEHGDIDKNGKQAALKSHDK